MASYADYLPVTTLFPELPLLTPLNTLGKKVSLFFSPPLHHNTHTHTHTHTQQRGAERLLVDMVILLGYERKLQV